MKSDTDNAVSKRQCLQVRLDVNFAMGRERSLIWLFVNSRNSIAQTTGFRISGRFPNEPTPQDTSRGVAAAMTGAI